VLHAPDEGRDAHDEKSVPDDRSGERRLHDVDEPPAQREDREDQLRCVSERRVEESAETRSELRGGVLGPAADPSRQGKQRDRRGGEGDPVGPLRETRDDGDGQPEQKDVQSLPHSGRS
jgi:plasmid stabilization system protein ParE